MVVASSGMLTGGRIMHHLKDFLPDPKSTLLFIGYQGEGTLGRHIQDGGSTARIDGEEIAVRCRVRVHLRLLAPTPTSTSSRPGSRHFAARGADGRPKRVFIVHGDPDAAEAFAARIRAELGMDAHVPAHREVVEIA